MNSVEIVGMVEEINIPSGNERSGKSGKLIIRTNKPTPLKNQPLQLVDQLMVRVPENTVKHLVGLKIGDMVEIKGRTQGTARRSKSDKNKREFISSIVAERLYKQKTLVDNPLIYASTEWTVTGQLLEVSREGSDFGWAIIKYGPVREKKDVVDVEFVNAVRFKVWHKVLIKLENIELGTPLRIDGHLKGLHKKIMGTEDCYLDLVLTGDSFRKVGCLHETIFEDNRVKQVETA